MHERTPHDERVEACRDRGAHLQHADGRRAILYCRVTTGWIRRGGHLWWRHWSTPHHWLEGFWLVDEKLTSDFLSLGDDLTSILDDFDRGVIVFKGEEWRVQWMDDDASRVFRDKHEFEVT